MCSNSPHSDGTPAMSFIPSCVEVDDMPSQGIWQPTTLPPQPAPEVDTFNLSNPYLHELAGGVVNQEYWDDSLFYLNQPPVPPPYNDPWYFPITEDPGPGVSWSEYVTLEDPDSNISIYAVTPYDYDPNPPTDNPDYISDTATYDSEVYVYDSVNYYWIYDVQDYNRFEGAEAQYSADSIAWIKNEQSYTPIWNQTQADTDASRALQNWLNQCDPPVPSTGILSGCCLHIVMDTSIVFFQTLGASPVGTWAVTVNNTGGAGFPSCSDTSCPYFARYIAVNVSPAMLYQTTNFKQMHPDTNYSLHPPPLMGFYTSLDTVPTVYSGYSSLSFYTLMEHEIGHYLGLLHPDNPSGGGTTCNNCYTQNPPYILSSSGNYILNPHAIDGGYQTVLEPILVNGKAPMSLSSEDICQFQKLYCPDDGCPSHGGACALDGVKSSENPTEDFKAEIFPNPTTGACTLQYQLLDRELVQVAIYDMIGNQIRVVSSGYEEEGVQTISLGTENLPSGNYVCRVRVGNVVGYINLVVQK